LKLTPLCDFEFQHTSTDFVGFGAGGQYLGTLDGAAKGERLSGALKLVNTPPKRPDNVNCPTFRGILTTEEGAKIFLEMNGIAILRAEDQARVFTTSLLMRSGDARYAWVNTVFGVMEGVLNTTTDAARGAGVRLREHRHAVTRLRRQSRPRTPPRTRKDKTAGSFPAVSFIGA
jgi:hypothetical protein